MSMDADSAVAPPIPPSRPLALPPLYATFIALQGLDVHSTLEGVRSGRVVEANPLLGDMTASPAVFIAFKAGTTAAVIALCEQLRRNHHGTTAVFVMIGLNSAYAAVVAHNYQLLRP